MNKKEIGKGNVFHVILEVNSLLNIELFERELNQFINKHAIFKGSVSRALNLAPYWKINKDKKIAPVVISTFRIQEFSELIPCCTKIFEKHDLSNECYLSCNVYRSTSIHCVMEEKRINSSFSFFLFNIARC